MAGKLAVTHDLSSDLLQDLKRLGFTEYEGRVYVQLLRQAPATAYEIAKAASVPRPNTYQALESLAKRGAALPVSENPVRYVAAEPEAFLDSIARQTKSLCSDLADRLTALAPTPDDQYVWTLRGDAVVHDRIEAMIADGRETIWIKAADDIIRRHKDALRAAAGRGIDILMILFGPDPDEFRFTDRCRIYVHEATGVRMGTADNLFTLAIDHVEMLTAAMGDEVIAAHTRNRPIVTVAESLIRHDYYMAEIFARFGPEIEAAFGPYLRDLRLGSFTPEQAESFRKRTGL